MKFQNWNQKKIRSFSMASVKNFSFAYHGRMNIA